MVNRHLKYFILFLSAALLIGIYGQQKVNDKKTELEELRKQIAQLELELKSKTKLEKDNVQYLEKISKQSLLLKKLINRLEREEQDKQGEITGVEEDLARVEGDINNLRESYAKYIIWVYKNSKYSELKYLLDSKSIQQALLRFKYLDFITEKNKAVLTNLNEDKREYLEAKNQLRNQLAEKENLVQSKLTEQSALEKREKDRKAALTALRKDI